MVGLPFKKATMLSIAQLVEHQTVTLVGTGSIPVAHPNNMASPSATRYGLVFLVSTSALFSVCSYKLIDL